MKWLFPTVVFGILSFNLCLEKFQGLTSPAVAMMSGKVPLTEYCVMFYNLTTRANIQNIPRHEEKIVFVNNLFVGIFIFLAVVCLSIFLMKLIKGKRLIHQNQIK